MESSEISRQVQAREIVGAGVVSITHSRAEGTLIGGTRRGDGSAEVLKRNGWRWGRSIGMWFVPQSRDMPLKRHIVDASAAALTRAGFQVSIDVDDTARAVADVEADRSARQADRVEALEAKAARKHAAAEIADKKHVEAHQALPPFGEPIKVGHHSERRHRKAIDNAWNALGKSVEADRAAREADRRTDSAADTTRNRFDVGVTRRRIDKLEAEIRGDERELTGYSKVYYVNQQTGEKVGDVFAPAVGGRREHLLARIAEKREQVAFWREQVAQAAANGAVLFDRSMLRKGDLVSDNLGWHRVLKVNSKSGHCAAPVDRGQHVHTSLRQVARAP